MWIYILIAVAFVIIVGLTAYAVKLLRALRMQKRNLQNAWFERVKRLKESIEIIAKAMQNGDCNFSEGVLRIKMLIEPLGMKLTTYSAMAELYEVVKDMPTHQARKVLKKNERMRLDLTRESAEANLEQRILLELKQLLIDIEKF